MYSIHITLFRLIAIDKHKELSRIGNSFSFSSVARPLSRFHQAMQPIFQALLFLSRQVKNENGDIGKAMGFLGITKVRGCEAIIDSFIQAETNDIRIFSNMMFKPSGTHLHLTRSKHPLPNHPQPELGKIPMAEAQRHVHPTAFPIA